MPPRTTNGEFGLRQASFAKIFGEGVFHARIYTQSRMRLASENYTGLRIVPNMPTPYTRDMGLRVREMRLARGWTQDDLADHAGLRQATISKVESRPDKTEFATLVKIAEAFGVQVGDLVEGIPGSGDLKRLGQLYLLLSPEDQISVTRHVEALAPRPESAA